jgi:hypothetical protein
MERFCFSLFTLKTQLFNKQLFICYLELYLFRISKNNLCITIPEYTFAP